MGEPKLTPQTMSVLSALMEQRKELSGSEIARVSSLSSGTLYPVLQRLEKAGWLSSRWEVGDPVQLGRPRRRYYQVTALGAARLRAEGERYGPMFARLGWA